MSQATSLYLHIPFCHRICPYCSFYKHTPGKTNIGRFLEAILTEAQYFEQLYKPNFSTLYLGGGTPSMLSPKHLSFLMQGIGEVFDLKNTHTTLEANPATFGESKAELFRSLGANRISLGIQSFSPHVLKTLGREHSREEAIESVNILKSTGVSEINIDLMFSIPGQSISDWKDTLDTAISLKPDHISAYNLTYEEDTPFFDSLRQHDDESRNAEMFSMAANALKNAGFQHYETSNYAQPGMESRHNQSYWKGDDYLGLGPSAVSTINGSRWKNAPDTAKYIQSIEAIGHAKTDEEIIDTEAFRIERIALLLRTSEGLPAHYLDGSSTGIIDQLVTDNLAIITNDKLVLIGDGKLLVDSIAERLV